MKKLLLTFAMVGSLAAFASPKSTAQSFIDRLQSAFNKDDPAQLGKVFAQDATVITPDGKTLHGRDDIQKDMGARMKAQLKDAKSEMKLLGTRPVGKDAIWVDVSHVLTNAVKPDGTKGTQRMHLTLLLEKQGNEWLATEARPYAFMPAQGMGTGGAGK
jgi:uncharacterized protein (TIGR02246 family)